MPVPVLPNLMTVYSCVLVGLQMLISGMPGGKDGGDKKKAPPSNGKGGGDKKKAPPSNGKGGGSKAKQQASPA